MKSLIPFLSLLFVKACGGFFVPIARSVSVTKIAKSIELADSTVVVSRNSTGHPIAFHDFCPHRGASFDHVAVKDNTVVCPYHGFEFDITQDGILTSGLGVKPGCSSLKMIDCVERNGLVWACIDGDDEIKPPPEIPQASDPTFRKISGSVVIRCPVEQLVENILDSCHVSQIHSFGNSMEPEPLLYKAQKVSPTRGDATFKYNAGKNSMFDGVLDVYNWYDIPCTAGTSVTSGDNVKVVEVHAVQLANGYTKVFWGLYRNWWVNPWMDVVFDVAMKITLNEDKEILEKCSFEHGDKFNGRYDKLQLLYRKSLKGCSSKV